MLFELSNEFLSVKISAKGAEMHSVFSKKLNKEILWQADPAVWARHAPVLFPIVGRLKDDVYTYDNKTYSLPQHGFARDKEFTVIEASDTHVLFELRDDEETLKHYPFSFVLQIKYFIRQNSLSCYYFVSNPSDKPLFFSIGAHPGFNCPLFPDEQFSDYNLIFWEEETAQRILLQNGLITDMQEPVIKKDRIGLKKELFDKDAIVLTGLKSNVVILWSEYWSLLLNRSNMPYFGIWTKKDCERFICIEPWAGIADHANTSGKLEEKEGIIRLDSHQQYDCGFSIVVQGKDGQ